MTMTNTDPGKLTEVVDLVLLKIIEGGPVIIIALLVIFIANRLAMFGLKQLEEQTIRLAMHKKDYQPEMRKRIATLYGVFRRATYLLLIGIGTLIVLTELGLNIGPILAAAGVLGLAVSFGAQSLVKDIISGVFILFENQIRVGDVAIINGTGGLVEEINVRTVVLRDLQGVVHIFPNGSISTISNMTKDWSACVLDVGVAYKEDTDNVVDVLREIAAGLRKDETYGPKIIDDLEVFGVDSFGDSAVVIKVRFKTRPIEQWAVAREYRRRIKKAFDERGIEIPFPHRTLYFGEASRAFELLMRNGAAMKVEAKNLEPKDADKAEIRNVYSIAETVDNPDATPPGNDER